MNVEKVKNYIIYSTGYVCRLPAWLLVEQNDHTFYIHPFWNARPCTRILMPTV